MKKLFFGLVAAAAMAQPAFAQDSGDTSEADNAAKDGFRIEARATYETPTISSVIEDDDVYKLGSAVAVGGEIGYDIAAGDNFVIGIYGQYEISNVEACDGGFCVSTTDYLEAGVHLGYAVGDAGQVYGKLGYGKLGFETNGVSLDSTENGSGIAFALGYEHGFGNNFYGRVEGGYADVGEVYGLNFQRRHFGISLGARF